MAPIRDRVYEIFTNLSSYEKWHPLIIIKSTGELKTGNTIKNILKNGRKEIVFKLRVLKTEKGKAFEWLGSLIFKGLFDGLHYFYIQKIQEYKINLVHDKNF